MKTAVHLQRSGDPAVETSLVFLQDLLNGYRPRDFDIRFWDGSSWGVEAGRPTRFTLVIENPGALRKMFWPPNEISFGEAYIQGYINVEGDIEEVFDLADYLRGLDWSVGDRVRCAKRLLTLPVCDSPIPPRRGPRLRGGRHTKERDRQAVTYHYDVSNAFYALWLDRRMTYSCGYYMTPGDTLETAQEQKLDYLCRKLRLCPGERLLDIGCGWGGLLLHAGRRYDVEATGITLSRPQAELAADSIRREGLHDSCRVEVLDYRDINETGTYDKLVSVGMFEHVGESRMADYFRHAWDLLRPGGIFLNHGISLNPAWPVKREPSFVDRYVFPDGELVPLHATLRAAEECGFEVRDVESLREHYMLTLRHWVKRLEEKHDEAVLVAGEGVYRTWRLFMAGAAHDFDKGRLTVHQTLLARPDGGHCGLPLTRSDWYA